MPAIGATAIGWDNLDSDNRRLLQMPKNLLDDADFQQRWPQPGKSKSIELIADEDRTLRFFLDVAESARSSSLMIGLVADRKSKLQTRVSSTPIIRVDYAANPAVLGHRNPDGTVVRGTHVHLNIDGFGLKWAFPLGAQSVLNPASDGLEDIWNAFQETCRITEHLQMQLSLGV